MRTEAEGPPDPRDRGPGHAHRLRSVVRLIGADLRYADADDWNHRRAMEFLDDDPELHVVSTPSLTTIEYSHLLSLIVKSSATIIVSQEQGTGMTGQGLERQDARRTKPRLEELVVVATRLPLEPRRTAWARYLCRADDAAPAASSCGASPRQLPTGTAGRADAPPTLPRVRRG